MLLVFLSLFLFSECFLIWFSKVEIVIFVAMVAEKLVPCVAVSRSLDEMRDGYL